MMDARDGVGPELDGAGERLADDLLVGGDAVGFDGDFGPDVDERHAGWRRDWR
jgi:hypothetical protein